VLQISLMRITNVTGPGKHNQMGGDVYYSLKTYLAVTSIEFVFIQKIGGQFNYLQARMLVHKTELDKLWLLNQVKVICLFILVICFKKCLLSTVVSYFIKIV
jgi:hypothetical protein